MPDGERSSRRGRIGWAMIPPLIRGVGRLAWRLEITTPTGTLPAPPYVVAANHYSFLSPWPESLRSAAIPPSLDTPGFDRRAFHDRLYPDIVTFLRAAGTRR